MATTISKQGVRSQGSRILDICRDFQESSFDWDEDCAIVSAYYSGKVAETAEDQDTLGLVDHANFSVGRQGLVRAREETLSAFTKPKQLINIKLRDYEGTPFEKSKQEQTLTQEVDKLLRKRDPVFLDEMCQMVDRQTMHGDAVVMFPPEGEGWRPFTAKILADPDAPQNMADDGFARWAVYSDLQIGDALSAIETGQDGWEDSAMKYLKDLWERRYDIADDKDPTEATYVSTFDDAFDMVEHISPEEWANQGHIGANLTEFYNSRFRCFYFYQKDFSRAGEGIPIDLYIVARVEPRMRETESYYDGDPLLYAKKAAYSDISRCGVGFVLDSNLGVDSPSWSTIRGLGHVNYNSDRFTNLLLSSMINSSIDKNTPLIEVADSTDTKALEKFIKDGYRANSLIPAGASFVDKSKNGTSIGEALNMIGYLQTQANGNAVGHTGQTAAPEGELRAQAVNRAQQDQRTASNRGEAFAGRIRAMCCEIARRITEEIMSPSFYGREATQIKALKKRLREADVDLVWVTPSNIDADYSRLVGDGDPAQRQAIVNESVARIGLIPAEHRNGVLTEWYAGLTGDWERAHEIYEKADSPSPDQEALAMGKAGDMYALGVPYPVTTSDVAESQLPVFVQIGQNIVDRAVQAGQFENEAEAAGLTAIGQHAILLVQQLEQRGMRDLADQFGKAIQGLITEAQEPLNNMRQAQEAQQDPKLQIEGAKLELAQQKEQREMGMSQHKVQKDMAQQEVQQRKANFNEVLGTRRLLVEEDRIALEKFRTQQEAIQKQIDSLEQPESN